MILGISGYKQVGKSTVGNIILDLLSKPESPWEVKQFSTKLKEICSTLTGISVEDFEKEEIKSKYLEEEWNVFNAYSNEYHDKINSNPATSIDSIKNVIAPAYLLDGNPFNISIKEEKITVRELLQKVGTDLFRNQLNENVWVNALMKDYILIPSPKNRDYLSINGKMVDVGMSYDKKEYPNWIITDVRFPNEAKAIKDKKGIMIRVNRLICPKCSNTENFHFDYLTDNPDICNECGYRLDSEKHVSETALDSYEFDYTLENSGTIEELIEKVKQMLIHFKLL